MIRIDHEQVARLLDYRSLIDKLDQLFVEGCTYPPRAHHRVPVSGKPDATLLLMPSWSSDGFLGVKIAAVFPGNREVGLPSVSAEYLLMNATDGTPLALIDGSELTARRTAATSALAADLLARSDARSLLVVGTGRLSRHLARAHLVVRPHLEVTIWGRNPDSAAAVAADLRRDGINAGPAADLATAAALADIISCATHATRPLVRGDWLKPGVHLDLVGSFTPQMREVDDVAVAGARVCCDTLDAVHESGDLLGPVEQGLLARESIAELAGLLRGDRPARKSASEKTLFKSVGCALEDLGGAMLAYRTYLNHDAIA